MRITTRTTLAALAGLVGLAAIATATPAAADDWHGRGHGWGHNRYHHDRVVVVNRPYYGYGYRPYYVAPRPVYVEPRYYAPAPVYAPPPVYYGPPSISLTLPLR
jgi:hypothetical protein